MTGTSPITRAAALAVTILLLVSVVRADCPAGVDDIGYSDYWRGGASCVDAPPQSQQIDQLNFLVLWSDGSTPLRTRDFNVPYSCADIDNTRYICAGFFIAWATVYQMFSDTYKTEVVVSTYPGLVEYAANPPRGVCNTNYMSRVVYDTDSYNRWCYSWQEEQPLQEAPWQGWSPVVIDVAGDGFDLTDAAEGVRFDLDADGAREQLSWTAAGSDDSWLALDLDGDGRIGNGRELFGNFTPQPEPPAGEGRNGFLALAEYDKAGAGGNSDSVIDARDGVFPLLRLWRDADHDGVSQGSELRTLASAGLKSVAVSYKESKRTDAHGNEFHYRAKVKDAHGAQAGRWAYDVFLLAGR